MPFDDAQESRAFQHFHLRTATDASGFYSSDFWSSLVPRAAVSEPSIRHAVLAFSALHERFARSSATHNRDDDDGLSRFALLHYNQAIKSLIKPYQRLSVDLYLMSCVVFFCIEVRCLT